jgi:hypothetical protein
MGARMNSLQDTKRKKCRNKNFGSFPIAIIFCAMTFFLFSTDSNAMNRMSRLGLGYTGQLVTNMDALSFKIQKGKGMSFGGLLGYSSGDSGGFGAGVKVYKILFNEPKLDFYAAAMAAMLSQKTAGVAESGFQVDLTLGSEFSFEGIESLGFSVEFGLSVNKIDEFQFGTTGFSFLVGAVHFYL